MKRFAAVLMVVVLLIGVTGVFAGPPETAPTPAPGPGPAPKSGDGIPDGSGFDEPPPYQGDAPAPDVDQD